MSTKNTGGSAFPAWDMTFNSKPDLFSAGTSEGMTLRDHFAGLAMEGMMMGCVGTIGHWPEVTAYAKGPYNAAIAERAYAMADAMLKAREQ